VCSYGLLLPYHFPTRRSSDLPSRSRRLAPSAFDFSAVKLKIVRDFCSATCPRGVHWSVSSLSSVSAGSAFSSEMPVQRLNHRYRSEEHTSELQSRENLVCRLL